MNSLVRSRSGFSFAGLAALIVVLAAVVWLTNPSTRECSTDSACGKDRYCGSDFSCHQFPVITVQNTEIRNDFTQSAVVIGVAIVIAALILKKWQ